MRRVAMICTIISVILLAYGLVDYLTNYNWAQGDQDPLFGNPRILLNDGATVLVAGGFLTVGSILMWLVAVRRDRGGQQQIATVRKEHGDQQKS